MQKHVLRCKKNYCKSRKMYDCQSTGRNKITSSVNPKKKEQKRKQHKSWTNREKQN